MHSIKLPILLLQVYLTATFCIALANRTLKTASALETGPGDIEGFIEFPKFKADLVERKEEDHTSEDQNNDIHTDRLEVTHRRTSSWSSRIAQWCCGKMEHTDDQPNQQPSSSQDEMSNDRKENDDARQSINAQSWVMNLARYPAESAGRRRGPRRPPTASRLRRIFGYEEKSYSTGGYNPEFPMCSSIGQDSRC